MCGESKHKRIPKTLFEELSGLRETICACHWFTATLEFQVAKFHKLITASFGNFTTFDRDKTDTSHMTVIVQSGATTKIVSNGDEQ